MRPLRFIVAIFLIVISHLVHAQCVADAGNDVTLCAGSNIQLDASGSSVPSGPVNYTWSPATGLSDPNIANPVSTVGATTSYTVTITDNGNNCSATDNITVTVVNPPTVGFTFSQSNSCANIPVNFTNTSTGSGLTYQWNFDNPSSSNNTSTLENPSHIFVSTGNGTEDFDVTLTVTDVNGCSNTATQTITVTQTPGADLTDPFNSFKNCDGTNFNLTVFNTTANNSNSNYQVIWDDGTPDFNSNNFPGAGVTHTYSTSDIFDLLFIVTGNNGCIDTSSHTVANITNPAIGAANPGGTTGCGPLNLCFPLSNFSSNHPTTYYVVDYGDGSPLDTLLHPPPTSICHTYTESSCGLPGNSYTFGIKAINLCDSSEATVSPIRVYTGPVAEIDVTPNPGCTNTPITFLNNSVEGFNTTCANTTLYQWDFGDGTTATVFALSNEIHTYTAPGIYEVVLSTSNNCTTTSDTIEVCIEDPPTPLFTLTPDTACVPFDAAVTDLSTVANTCDVVYNWTVLFNGSACLPSAGTWNFINGTTASDQEPEFEFLDPGEYTVRLTLTNSCGTFTYDLNVLGKTEPEPAINLLSNVCFGTPLSPSATINDCEDDLTSYAWSFTGATPASSTDSLPGAINYSVAGNYTISLDVSNSCGTTTTTAPVTVNTAPASLNPTVNTPLCAGDDANFDADNIAGITYTWSGANNFNSTLEDPSIIGVSIADSGWYYVQGSANGCNGIIDSVLLSVVPPPIITITPTNIVQCVGDTTQLTASGANSYTWTPMTGLNFINLATVEASPNVTTTYSVEGAIGSCSSTETVTVTVNNLPLVNAGTDITLCNQPITETLLGNPAGGTWSGAGGITAGGDFTPSSVGNFEVYYTYTDANGCTNSDTLNITVNDPEVLTMGSDTAVCLNSSSFNLSANPTGGSWSGGDVSLSGVYDPITTGSFYAVYTIGSGTCATQDSIEITVNPLPTVNAGQDEIVCIDHGTLNLTGTPAGGTWSGNHVTVAGEFDPNAAGAGIHTLTYTYVDPVTNCENSDDLQVTVNALPIVNAGSDQTLCNQPIGVTLSGTPSGGLWTGTNITNPNTGDYTPNGVISDYVYYTFTDVNGCTNIDSTLINVVDPVPADAGLDSAVCIDATNVQFNGAPAGGNWSGPGVSSAGIYNPTGVGTFTLTYNFGSGTCATTDELDVTVNPLPTVNAGADTTVCLDAPVVTLNGLPSGGTWSGTGIVNSSGDFDPSVAGVGTFSLTYSYTDPVTGCVNTDIIDAIVNPLSTADAGIDTTVCNQPFPIQFFGTPSGGTWSGQNVTAAGVFTPNGVGSYTITYTYTLGSGCEDSDDRVITVVDPVQANAGIDREICIFEPDFQLNGVPSGGTWTGTNITGTGLFSPITDGDFDLVYSIGAGNCETKDTMTFTVHPLPIVDAGLDEEFCISEAPYDFTGSPAGGTWSGVGITNAVNGTFEPAVASTGTHKLIYEYTNSITTCVNEDSVFVTVNPLPTPAFTIAPILCVNVSENITNNTLLGDVYSWNFGNGSGSVLENPSVIYTSTGFYDIQLIATTVDGCVDSITQNIEVREPPVADFTLAPDSGCAPLNVAYTNLSSGTSITYSWNFGDGSTSALQNPADVIYQQSIIKDTTYYIQLDVTNFCGTVSHTDSVRVMPSPTAVFVPEFDQGCSPWPADIANNSLGLPDDYYWDFGDGTTATLSDSLITHTFITGTSDTTFTIMLAVTNECGTDTAYHDVTVLPNQVNAFYNTDVTNGCEPLTVNFTNFSQGSSLFHSWDFGDGNTSTVYSPSHTFTTAGNYTVSLFINDGCSYDTTTVDITVNPSPFVDFTSTPDSVCVNEPFTFNNFSIGLASSDWDFGDGNTSNLFNPSYGYAATGVYNVTLTGTSLTNGCTASVTHSVVVGVQPEANFLVNPISGCVPLEVDFTNTSTNYNFQSWDFGDGNNSGANSPTHTFSQDGTYTVTLYVENSNGCNSTEQQIITVYPLPVADFTITTSDNCYTPTILNTTNNSTGAVNYEWDFDDGNTSLLNNPFNVYNNPGTYDISLIATSLNGCKDTTTVSLTVYPTPEAAFFLPTDTACEDEQLLFYSLSDFADSVVWDFGNGETVYGDSVFYAYPDAGTFPVTIYAYGAGGCGDTLTINQDIIVNPTPTADFSYVNVQNPDPLSGRVEFTNLSTGATEYLWHFIENEYSDEVNPIHRYNNIGTFNTTLFATNEFNCTDSITKEIIVEYFKGLHVPNALYPGHPDFGVSHFIPKGVGLQSYHVMIYDTWGILLWESTALDAAGRPTEAWDGTFQGAALPQDVYVWKVEAIYTDQTAWQGKEYGENIVKKSGTVTLIR